jgi:hypothetical protein
MFLRQVSGRSGHGIKHVLELDTAQGGQVGCVNATNAASAKNCNIFHGEYLESWI